MMGRFGLFFVFWHLMGAPVAQAQLDVTVSPVTIMGQKALVRLALKNGFAEAVV
jgi:hypothetical protein